MSKSIVVKQSNEEQHIVYGEVYAPMRMDTDNEYMDAEAIRMAAHDFMRNLRIHKIDTQHNNVLSEGASVVESFIAREDDPIFIPGSWVVGVHVPNEEDWQRIKKGELNGFSLQAMVSKTPVVVEIDIPPVISGTTMTEQDHVHKFYVAYDEDGNFLGGRTDVVNGHSHVVKRGTITEPADNHFHKFSHVDNLEIVSEQIIT